jgi:hypothetical protein
MNSVQSLIYKYIFLYRLLLRLLYRNKQEDRFTAIFDFCELHQIRSIVELCFADTQVADWAYLTNRDWQGFDISSVAVRRASKLGYRANECDVKKLLMLPESDVSIMIGSLYQFKEDFDQVLDLMLSNSGVAIISEPTTNVANSNSVLKFLVGLTTRTGYGAENFRFTKLEFETLIETYSLSRNLKFESLVSHSPRDTVYTISKIPGPRINL